MMNDMTQRRPAAVLALCAVLGSGCSDGGAQGDDDRGAGAADTPLYVLANEVYTDSGSTSYLHVLKTLDVTQLDDSRAIEYAGGRALITTYAGWLFVVGPESPVISRFSAGDDGSLVLDGEMSLLDYGFAPDVSEWGNSFIHAQKAYLYNAADGTSVIWNPSTMEITGLVDQNGFDLVRDGFTLDGSPGVVRGDRLFRTMYWIDWDAYEWSEELYLAVYDTTSDRLLELVEDRRCPGLNNRPSRDEQGNLYFTNWIWNVGATLVSGAPASCALRVAPGEEQFDPDWTLPYRTLTEGREAAMYSYLGDGRGLLSVFHDENMTIDETTAPAELVSTPNWRVWSMDFEAGTGAPLEGLGWMTGAATSVRLDGRSFLMVPGENWASTDIYEIESGAAVHRFGVDGWSFQYHQLR